MKKLSKTVEKHAVKYRKLLDENWKETGRGRKWAEWVMGKMDQVIRQLPEAHRQAHERIIGGRQVPSQEKILSIYEEDIHTVVRGKAGARVEFGNSLLLVETAEGFIVHHELLKEGSRGDADWLNRKLDEIAEVCFGNLGTVVGDRGFSGKTVGKKLEEKGIYNAICPKNPKELKEKLEKDEKFAGLLKRRGQTEGRVGILKNVFLEGGVPKAKGFKNRQLQVAWAVLSHNLWVGARLAKAKDKEKKEPEIKKAA